MTMNENTLPNGTPQANWPHIDPVTGALDRAALPTVKSTEPAAVGLLKQGVQVAHATIDRLADSATPAVQQLSKRASEVNDVLHAKADQFIEVKDEWAEGARRTVRKNPLACVAAAMALGMVIARVTR